MVNSRVKEIYSNFLDKQISSLNNQVSLILYSVAVIPCFITLKIIVYDIKSFCMLNNNHQIYIE